MRKVLSVDNEWRLLVEDSTENATPLTHSQAYAGIKAGGMRGYAGVGYNDDAWRKVNLPHDAKVEAEFSETEGRSVHGGKKNEEYWYRKSFVMPEEYRDKHFTLVFEGISPYAEIFINGSLIETSISAYAESVLDITPRMHFGSKTNVIAVYVDGRTYEGWWYEGAGIYRHTKLYIKEMLHIAHNGLYVSPVKNEDGTWTVNAEVEVENSAYKEDSFGVEVVLLDKDGAEIGKASAKGNAESDKSVMVKMQLPVKNPELWDVDNPVLYRAVCRVVKDGEAIDEEAVSFGFRTFNFDPDKGFSLNGKRMKLKGVCVHQDHAGVGVALPDSIHYYRIALLKEMGVNAYRCAHNWPAKEILDACDRLGVLVMDENRRFETMDKNIQILRTMIKRDRNHPSIIMWSMFNEENLQGTDEGHRIFCKLRSEVEKLDKTRPIMGAMHHGFFDDEGSAKDMDVIGINYNLFNYDRLHKKYPNIPIVGSENTSTLNIRGEVYDDPENHIHKDYDEFSTGWGSTVQACWKAVSERDFVSGMFMWTGFDYRGEPTPFTYPTISSLFGIMDTCGFEKTVYYVSRACFRDEPLMHIFPHWNHKAGDTVRVITVTNCQEVELFLNGESLGRRESDVCKQCVWEVEYKPGELKAVGYNGGKEIVTDVVKTAGKPVKIEAVAHKTAVYNDGTDAVAVNVKVLDAEGNYVQTAQNLIKFEVEGGIIRGVGNGNPNSHEADVASERHLFNGRCQAIVMCEMGAETLKVKAMSEGLEAAEVVISVVNKEPEEAVMQSDNKCISTLIKSVKPFAEKPDGNLRIADTDMNDYVPVAVDNVDSQLLDKGWYLYRVNLELANSAGNNVKCRFSIDSFLYDEYEMWVNGKVVSAGINEEKRVLPDRPNSKSLVVEFDSEGAGSLEITLLVKVNADGRGGIGGKNNNGVQFIIE